MGRSKAKKNGKGRALLSAEEKTRKQRSRTKTKPLQAAAPVHNYFTRRAKALKANGQGTTARNAQPASGVETSSKKTPGRQRKTATVKISETPQSNLLPQKRGRQTRKQSKNLAGAEKATTSVSKKGRGRGREGSKGGRKNGASATPRERQSETAAGPSSGVETHPEVEIAILPVPIAKIKREVIDLTEEDVTDDRERHYQHAERIEAKGLFEGVIHYHLKFAGWPSASNTWEPLANLTRFGCQHLVDQYENSVATGEPVNSASIPRAEPKEEVLEAQPSNQEPGPSTSSVAVPTIQVRQVQMPPLHMTFPASLQLHAVMDVWAVPPHICYLCRFKTTPELDDSPFVDVTNTLLVPREGLRYDHPEKVIEFYEKNNFVDANGTVRVIDKPSVVWAI